MKLTNQEIEAIAGKIVKKYDDEREKELTIVKKDKKILSEAKRIHKLLQSIPKAVRDNYYQFNTSTESIADVLINNVKLKSIRKEPFMVKQEIIIASIDSETLEQLFKKLKIKL